MHYHYFTLEQRESLERLIRSRAPAQPELIEHLHSPDYGVCAGCGADIPYTRLLEAPSARLCKHCEDQPCSSAS